MEGRGGKEAYTPKGGERGREVGVRRAQVELTYHFSITDLSDIILLLSKFAFYTNLNYEL